MRRKVYQQKYKRKYREERKKKGICIVCGIRQTGGKVLCSECMRRTVDNRRFRACGLTHEQFEKTRSKQKNRCAICRKEFTETPRADHDHKTKKFRELLCNRCNQALGFFCDDPKIVRNAAKYLTKHRRKANDN
jgi:hypothetical protein